MIDGGLDFGRSDKENKKKYWKELKRIRKSGARTEQTVKDGSGRLLRDDAIKRWAEYFENLLNDVEEREAEIVAVVGVCSRVAKGLNREISYISKNISVICSQDG